MATMISYWHRFLRRGILPWLVLLAVSLVPPTSSQAFAPDPAAQAAMAQQPGARGGSRGYTTSSAELDVVASRAAQGIEPYRSAVRDVLRWADKGWDYSLDAHESCRNANNPSWMDYERGVQRVYAKALAYQLTGQTRYAEEVKNILQQIMTEVLSISTTAQQCRLNFAWGTPELVESADLIEDYWIDRTCTGPLSTEYHDFTIGEGNCKVLFQNWLIKNPYYIVSYAAEGNQSNWGAAATNTLAYIADYLWDRPDAPLVHRLPPEMSAEPEVTLKPGEAYAHANNLALARMNGYRVDYHSSESCDLFDSRTQRSSYPSVKSQITPEGIVPEDARREEACNITVYNGEYQNYPQLHLGNNIQQCELMLRRGSSACYDNIDMTDVPNFEFVDAEGQPHTTHLYPGRGSLERAIDAIIIDSNTEWRHDSALELAYAYYSQQHRFDGVDQWEAQLNRPSECSQDVCFGTLTHGFPSGETPQAPVVVLPPPVESDRIP